MPILAGQIVTAAALDRMQPTPYSAEATAALNGTTTYQPIPGLTATIATETAGARYTASGVFDCSVTTVHASNLMVGKLQVNGTDQSGLAIHAMDTLDRDTVAMSWSGTLGAAGTQTFTLLGVINASGGAGLFHINSRLEVVIYEVT
ncbi:hypothetical protein ACH4E8_29405 [Streptomyces sp. NPDC017979]|uniref:hypothetical protein n=1 Tax=Streptomyces sp. NPDC017979 TaxID=3365024 RepID=UPI0037B6BF1B